MSGYTPLSPKGNLSGQRGSKSSGSAVMNFITDALKNAQGGLVNSDGLLTAGPDPNAMAEAIERQAAGQDMQVQQKAQAVDPFTALSQQLYNSANSINVAPTPIEQLRKMAQDQVSAQYDPQIAALTGEINTHISRGQRSAKQARDMYGALAKDYLAQLPDITSQYKAQDDAVNQRYDQAQQQMQQEYQQNAQQQDAVLKQLGIQAAAPDASQQSKDDQAYFQNQSTLDQNNALNALAQQQTAESDYARNLSGSARMAGENTAQDIGQQLADYLNQANSQKDALNSSKQSAIAALLQQMQMQDQQRVQTQSQQQFDNMMKLFNFQLQAQNDAVKAAGGSNATGAAGPFGAAGANVKSGLPGAQNYLASVYPNQPILASNLMKLLNNVISNKDVTQGKFILDPGNPSLGQAPKYSNVGQQYMEDLLRQQFEQQGGRYNTGDINATMAALEAYLGKLR